MSRELSSLHHELDGIFRRTFGTEELLPVEGRGPVPAVNTFVKGNTYHFQAELPGLKKEDLDINLEGQTLTICGECKESREAKEEGYQVKESRFGSFMRRVTLPEGVNTDKVHATYEDGMLEITMPIAKAAAGRMIAIEGARKKELH